MVKRVFLKVILKWYLECLLQTPLSNENSNSFEKSFARKSDFFRIEQVKRNISRENSSNRYCLPYNSSWRVYMHLVDGRKKCEGVRVSRNCNSVDEMEFRYFIWRPAPSTCSRWKRMRRTVHAHTYVRPSFQETGRCSFGKIANDDSIRHEKHSGTVYTKLVVFLDFGMRKFMRRVRCNFCLRSNKFV